MVLQLHLFFGLIFSSNIWFRDLLREFDKKYEILLIIFSKSYQRNVGILGRCYTVVIWELAVDNFFGINDFLCFIYTSLGNKPITDPSSVRLKASWKICSLAVNGQSFLVIDGYLLNLIVRLFIFWKTIEYTDNLMKTKIWARNQVLQRRDFYRINLQS